MWGCSGGEARWAVLPTSALPGNPLTTSPLKVPAEWSSPSLDAPPTDSSDKHTVWVSCGQFRLCLEQRVPQLGSMQFSGSFSPNKPGHESGSLEPRQVCEILGQLLSSLSLSFFTCKMGPVKWVHPGHAVPPAQGHCKPAKAGSFKESCCAFCASEQPLSRSGTHVSPSKSTLWNPHPRGKGSKVTQQRSRLSACCPRR